MDALTFPHAGCSSLGKMSRQSSQAAALSSRLAFLQNLRPPCPPSSLQSSCLIATSLASSSLAGKRVMRGFESLLALSPPCYCFWYVHVSNWLLKIASDGSSTAFPGTLLWSQLSQAVSLPAATAHCFGSPGDLGTSFYPSFLH